MNNRQKNRLKKNDHSFRDLFNNNKYPTLTSLESKKRQTKRVFREIMTENLPNLAKDTTL